MIEKRTQTEESDIEIQNYELNVEFVKKADKENRKRIKREKREQRKEKESNELQNPFDKKKRV